MDSRLYQNYSTSKLSGTSQLYTKCAYVGSMRGEGRKRMRPSSCLGRPTEHLCVSNLILNSSPYHLHGTLGFIYQHWLLQGTPS